MTKLSILIPVYNQEELVIKCLDSIPRRDDIEVLVRDDGSTDSTLKNLRAYAKQTDLNMKVFANKKNLGVSATFNRLLESAQGEYFHGVGSDDYLFTEEYSKLIDSLYETDADIVCLNLINNDGNIYMVTHASERVYCGQGCRFVRKAFAEGLTYPEDIKVGEDWYFNNELLARNPKVVYSGRLVYHYNYPREGSLCWQKIRGLL